MENEEEMWCDVKEDIASALEAGATLLSCIHPKQRNEHDKPFTPDIKANAAELKRTLTRLDEMKEEFEKFWKDHKLEIQYCLKVCLFEREISQVRIVQCMLWTMCCYNTFCCKCD